MTLTYISCSSDFYTFYVNVPLSLGCMIRKVSAEDIAIRGNGTGLEYMCPTRHFVYIFFNPVFQVSTAKNEINLFNNHVLIVAPVTFAPAGAMTPSAEFLYYVKCPKLSYTNLCVLCRPRWLSWMRRPTGDQEVAGSTPAEVGNILSWRLIVKYFLRSFSPFRRFKKGSCQFLAKECAQYWLTT